MIGFIDNLHCFFCKEKMGIDSDKMWELHELSPEQWEPICMECEEVTGIGEGK